MRRIVVVAVMVLLSTTVAVLHESNFGRYAWQSFPIIVAFYLVAFALTSYFAVWTATSLELPSFLLLSPLSARRRWFRFGLYGIGAGLAIYAINSFWYSSAVGATLRPWYLNNPRDPLEVLLLAAKAALLEETLYRLFAIPFLVSLVMRFRHGWRPRLGFERRYRKHLEVDDAPVRPTVETIALAILIAAVFFGSAHRFNPLPAMGFGMLLGVVYLRGGWESAVVAHFLGNYLLFAAIYL